MKKKVISLTIAGVVALSGVVSAASMWGTYKGNDIIKITVDGRPLLVKTGDVPGMSFNGRTMIPINLLKYAGVTYTWNQSTKTVDIHKTTTEPATSSVNPSNIANNIISNGGDGVTLVKINGELTSIVYFQEKSGIDIDWKVIQKILNDMVDYNAVYSRVVYYNGDTTIGYIEAKTASLKKFRNDEITAEQMKQDTVWSGFDSSSSGGTATGSTTSATIVSKIDGEFDGFENGKLFTLQNGQIWKQTSYEYKYTYKFNPKVTIYKDGSSWYMMVDGVDKQVKVEQIK
ncbi:hypothetical protein [Paenibacillus sacheonensis]|uniref:Copper amine oxidase-like N-terminal domain-containing protein n=1 Tax=Paenibacillus sacheonensis TaxID=742054 RepID=A0A7X5C083_9BACL|nr:hypothetical protein [Paenibacillus sacheonensis]NBC73458.1 hypothetical protein [Paenibacillus sacheonensis]